MRRFASVLFLILLSGVMPCGATLIFGAGRAAADSIDLTHATVVIRGGALPAAEKIAPVILTEEMAKRTGVRWSVTDRWPQGKRAVIAPFDEIGSAQLEGAHPGDAGRRGRQAGRFQHSRAAG